jgi:hypothetical protein
VANPFVFNPNAGGKLVQTFQPGQLCNQGGIGIQTGNSLAAAFPLVQWTDPYREKMTGLGDAAVNTIQIGARVPWYQRTAWRNWMLGSSATRSGPGNGDGNVLIAGGGVTIGPQGNVLVAGGMGGAGLTTQPPGGGQQPTIPISTLAVSNIGSNIIAVASPAGIVPGMFVEAPGTVQNGTTVISVSGNQITLSTPAQVSVVTPDSVPITFIPQPTVQPGGQLNNNPAIGTGTSLFGNPGAFIQTMPPATATGPVPSPTYYLTRACPYQCPDIGNETFYCTSVDLDTPDGAMGQDRVYEHDVEGNRTGGPDAWINFYDSGSARNPLVCKYVVTFSQLPFDVRSDLEIQQSQCNAPEMERYLERAPRGAIQSLPLPTNVLPIFTNQISPFQGGGVYNDPSGKIVGQSIPTSGAYILSLVEEMPYIWEQVPDPPWAAIAACEGCVNAATFDGARGWFSFTTGTVMCNAPLEKKRYRHASGRWYWRITYSFTWKPQGWNYFPVADGTYLAVTFNGKPLYPSADFTTLFQPGPPTAYSLAWKGG